MNAYLESNDLRWPDVEQVIVSFFLDESDTNSPTEE